MLSFAVALAHAEPLAQVDRHEVSMEGYDAWEVVPLGADGLVLVGKEDKGRTFSVQKLDTSFAAAWTGEFAPEERMALADTAASEETLWLAFHHAGRDSFTLVGFDRDDGTRVVLDFTADQKLTRLDGLVVDAADHAWVLGIFDARERGDLYALDLAARTARPMAVAEALGGSKVVLDRVTTGPAPEDRALSAIEVTKKHHELSLVPFGPAGLGPALRLAPEDDTVNLLTGTRVPLGPDRGVVLGTYASGGRDVVGAQGVYVAGYEAGAAQWTKYHSFTSFEHFFDYLGEKRRERMKASVARREADGRERELNYELLVHAPLILPDRTVFVAEAYYPMYITYLVPQTTTVSGITTTVMVPMTVFVGWTFSHATIAAFGPTGERLWDAAAPIGNVLLPRVRPVVAVLPSDDHLTVVYANRGKIYSLVADGNGVTGERGEQAPEAEQADEVVKTSADAYATWWYDNVFLVWGYEKLKGDEGRRTVFSFSALRAP